MFSRFRLIQLAVLVSFTTGCGAREASPPPLTTEQSLFGQKNVILARAVGADYQWTFVVPGIDGQPGTADDVNLGAELWLPPNRSVELSFESQDYVYTFLQPALNINEIAVPGIEATMRFDTPANGSFEISTSPLCGFMFAHADYRPFIRIGIPEDLKYDVSGIASTTQHP